MKLYAMNWSIPIALAAIAATCSVFRSLDVIISRLVC